ncbi:hypothetical protein MRB53_041199 [Persea americana]|nr:hypothetical protein MRB53_041199 [Persea americana]
MKSSLMSVALSSTSKIVTADLTTGMSSTTTGVIGSKSELSLLKVNTSSTMRYTVQNGPRCFQTTFYGVDTDGHDFGRLLDAVSFQGLDDLCTLSAHAGVLFIIRTICAMYYCTQRVSHFVTDPVSARHAESLVRTSSYL